jgi:hypothetical protein
VWSGEAGLSYVQTGGNTETQTVGAAARLTHDGARWKTEAQAGFLRGEAADTVTAKKWTAIGKAARAFDERLSAFGQTSYRRDLFAGIERENLLDATGTASFTDESRIAPADDRSFVGGRLGAAYRWKLRPSSELAVDADYLQGLNDADASRAKTAVSVTSALARILALKLTHKLEWVKEPVPGKRRTDTELLASIVARWPPAP